MKLPVHRIIPFSNVEGLGNRTSIFVQGCNANCLYCHNSETIPMQGPDVKFYTVDELFEVIKRHKAFIRGITVSGGEATIYHEFLTLLFQKVKTLGLTCYIDTNGFYDSEVIQDLIVQTDQFLFDIKGFGEPLEKLCFSNLFYEGQNLVVDHREKFVVMQKHLSNLEALLKLDKVEEVRLVYIKGYYDEKQILEQILETLKDYPRVQLKLIRVHVRGLTTERQGALKGAVPTKAEMEALEVLAYSLGAKKVVTIY